MSKIGNNKNFGKNLNVVMTHHGGEDILNNENLYPNSLIISAANNGEGLDLNSYALLATDNEGTPVRLTYTLREGNGLVTNAANSNYDIMSLEIDKDSILSSYKGYGLEVGKTNIIDNYTLAVYQDPDAPKTRIKVVTANLDKATDVAYGIVIGDNYTISANNGVLTVNTQNLDYVDDNLNVSGIVRFNPDPIGDEYDWRTVEANNGILHVITYNLDRATEDQVGVIKPDMVTTNVEQPSGTLSVITAGLDYATESTYGTVRPDNSTIQVNEGVIEAHAENMTCTTTTSYGVVKLDEVSLGVDYAGYTYVQRYYDILAILNRYMEDYDYIISRLIDHENRIAALENAAAAEYIYSFNNYGTRTTVLTEPYWDNINHVVVSDYELHTIVFSINTNCPFNVSFEFEDQSNVTPQITLQNVRLGNGAPIDASALQSHTFASTNSNESTLSFTFRCNNYTSSTDENYTLTNVTLKVSSINDSSIYKIGSHIFKRWNEAKYVENVPEPVYSTSTQVTKQYTYYGPYFDYWTGGEYTHALDTSLILASNPETAIEDMNDALLTLASRRTELSTARNNIMPGAASQVNKQNQNGTLIEYGYNDNLGEYAWIGAYSGSRTSYSFMFSTVKIVEEKTTKSITYLKDGQLSTELPTDWGTSDNPKIETSSSYYVSYMSSPVGTQIGRVNLNMTSDKAIRDMNYTGINDNWNSATETPNWLSYSITTVASNTGYYNILNVSSITSLTNKDRKATIKLIGNYPIENDTVWSANRRLESTPIANIGEQLNLSNELKFTLIEDVYEEQPNVNVIVQCMNNASNPLQITVTRTPSATVIGNSWGVVLKFYYTKSGIDATEKYGIKQSFANTVTYRTSTSSFTSTTNTSRISSTDDIRKENTLIDNEEVSPVVLIIKIDKNKTSEVWEANDSNIVPDSVYAILSDSKSSNNISSIHIDSCTAFGFNYGEKWNDNELEILGSDEINAFDENTDITANCSVYGTWPTASIEPANEITFGNASVTAVTVQPWTNNDDIIIDFILRPGNETSIPEGQEITSINENIIIYVDNVVYTCDNISVENTVWGTTGCTLRMHISNPHTATSNEQGDRGNLNLINNFNANGLSYITALKVYFKVTASNTSKCTMNYVTTLNGGLTDKIMINAQYNIGLSKQVSIPNALYNPNPGIIISKKEETENTVTQMAEMLEKLQNEIEILKGDQNISSNTISNK